MTEDEMQEQFDAALATVRSWPVVGFVNAAAVIAAADALADAASKPCRCFDGWDDVPYGTHNWPTSGINDCPVQLAVDAYRKAREANQ